MGNHSPTATLSPLTAVTMSFQRVGLRGCTAVGHTFYFDEAGETFLDESCVAFCFVFDVETAVEALPEISMERPVDLAKGFAVRSIDGDVKLCNGFGSRKLVRMLSVADQEGGYMLFVEHSCKFIDMGVEDGLAH